MKFSIGDKIVLKQTGEEGHVVSYINQQMVEVEVHGTSFPVYLDEIDHPYLKWFTEKKQQKKQVPPEQLPVEKQKFRPVRLAQGIYLSFMPIFKADEMEDIVDHLKIYLINELPVNIRFSYEIVLRRSSVFHHEALLHSFGHVYLHTVPYEDMNDQPRFQWQVSDASGADSKMEEGVLKIRPSKLFEKIGELLQKNEPSFSYLLVSDFVPKPREAVTQAPAPAPVRQVAKSRPARISSFADMPRYEIDLHIENLIPDHKGLSNSEIVDIQLKALERAVYQAIMRHQERLVIIHGLGSGVLREAVHKFLREVPETSQFVNEWQGKYGFGATEVHFRY
jgi:hypothetical protein